MGRSCKTQLDGVIHAHKHFLYIPTEQRNCEILKLLQIYKNDQKLQFMLTYM